MATGTAQGHQELAAALLGDHDRVEADTADEVAVTAALTDRMADAGEQLGVVVGEPGGALPSARLLVGEDHEQHVAGKLHALALRPEERGDHHRDPVLHVERAPTPDPAVNQLAAEGRAAPPLVHRGDDVDVALQDQPRAGAAGKPSHEVGTLGSGAVHLPFDSLGAEQRADPLDAGPLVSRRVGGVEADQLLEQLGGRHRPARNRSARKSAAMLAACWMVPPAARSRASASGSSRSTMSCS